MIFNTDHYFNIGNTHLNAGKPCQDYAFASVYDKAAFAIVADGCSTGGNTDVGARIVALSTASAIKDHWMINRNTTGESISSEVVLKQKIMLSGVRTTLDLKSKDMYATCAYVYISEEGGFVQVQGDGVIAIKYRNGSMKIIRFEWQGNAPFYPSYAEFGMEDFIAIQGNDLEAEAVTKSTLVLDCEGVVIEEQSDQLTLKQGISGPIIRIDDISEIEFVAVFTDGATQVHETDWKDAVYQLMAFKNTAGEFLKRRMIRGIKDFQKDNKKGPLDDIACAVIRIIPDKGGEVNDSKG
ncbi:MAG: protein phosphatase 2C domain-containing protein [Candidatus Colwellbacteria bacterium]|nr:protein phosphatase 2C domain-containing protein [Candidatus Colwellbacteria bacterium]